MAEVKNKKSVQNSDRADNNAPKKAKKKYFNPFSYTDPLQQKMVNCIMKQGKKTIAIQVLKDTFDELNRRGEENPLRTFETALQNATPTMEVKPKRIGGAVYQIPVEVQIKRQQTLAIRWVLQAARAKKGQPMARRLASDLIEGAQDAGAAVMRKKESHRMAQANKAFAHLARY